MGQHVGLAPRLPQGFSDGNHSKLAREPPHGGIGHGGGAIITTIIADQNFQPLGRVVERPQAGQAAWQGGGLVAGRDENADVG